MIKHNQSQRAFTLLEAMLVVAIMAVGLAVAVPNFSIIGATDIEERINRIAVDIRSAYDMAVLQRKTYRLVFMLAKGEYWLEASNRESIKIGDAKSDRDLSAEEEKEEAERFKESFLEYENLANQEFRDEEAGVVIKPFSPVIAARGLLEPPTWTKVETAEWGSRSLGPSLIFRSIQGEHHLRKQDLEELGAEGRAMLYFYPQGYAERALVMVYFRKGDLEVDPDKAPYSLTVNSFEGIAEIQSGEAEYKEEGEAQP